MFGGSVFVLISEASSIPEYPRIRLKSCAQNALTSAVLLVSKCCHISTRQLESLYNIEGATDFFSQDFEGDAEEISEQIVLREQEVASNTNDAQAVFREIQEVADCEKQGEGEEPEIQRTVDVDSSVPDGQDLVDLTSEEVSADVILDTSLPTTLRQAMTEDNFWTGLWRLAVRLRCGPAGLDGIFLKKGELVRRRARDLNWHQPLIFQC